jgi:1-acyl-sn-glycerol-3-phosphate acyltransferase
MDRIKFRESWRGLCDILGMLFDRKAAMRKSYLYSFTKALLRAYSELLLRMDVAWHEHCLPEGSKLFVANHPSASDPFLIHLLGRREQMSVLITGNAFAVPIFGQYLRYARQIAVLPNQRGAALEQARRYLEARRSVVIFPEGDFSPRNGGFREPHSGAARLALSTGVPVVPVGIYLPRERAVRIRSSIKGKRTVGYWYFHGPYGMTVGKAMHFEGNLEDRGQVNSISSTMMQWIKSLAYESEQRVRGLLPPPATVAAM